MTHLTTDEVQVMIGDKILHLEKKLSLEQTGAQYLNQP